MNIDPTHEIELEFDVVGLDAGMVNGKYISSVQFSDYNSFENPNVNGIKELDNLKIYESEIKATLPAKSVILINIH